MGNDIPDFVGMTQEELADWAWKYRTNSPTMAAQILPGRPKGYVAIVQTMAVLAKTYFMARKAREEGDHRKAKQLMEECDKILIDQLPDFARPVVQ